MKCGRISTGTIACHPVVVDHKGILAFFFQSARLLDAQMDAFKQAQAHHQAQQQPSEHWLQVQQQQAQAHHHQAHLLQAQAHAANCMYNRAGNRGQIPNRNSNGEYMGMASTFAPQLGQIGMQSVGTYGVDGSIGGRTRGADPDRVERRQRRAIKTRESAEKSRARKQAHNAELEAEKSQLKEENNRLKKEKEKRANYIEWLNLESTKSLLQSDGKKKLLRTSRLAP